MRPAPALALLALALAAAPAAALPLAEPPSAAAAAAGLAPEAAPPVAPGLLLEPPALLVLPDAAEHLSFRPLTLLEGAPVTAAPVPAREPAADAEALAATLEPAAASAPPAPPAPFGLHRAPPAAEPWPAHPAAPAPVVYHASGAGPSPPATLPPPSVEPAQAATAALGAAAFLGLALYVRLAPSAALASAARQRVLDAVRRDPGCTTGSVARALGIDYKTAMHHLRVLRRAGCVMVLAAAQERYFVAGDLPPARMAAAVALRASSARALLAALGQGPARAADLARALALSEATASVQLRRLAAAGLAARRADGRWERAGLPQAFSARAA